MPSAPQIAGMGRSTTTTVNEFAVRPELVRRAVAQHKTWIEQQLGVSLSNVVILESDLDIAEIGIERLLAIPAAGRPSSTVMKRLRPFVVSATTPPDFPLLCELSKSPRSGNPRAFLGGGTKSQRSALSWGDCPIALNIRQGNSEFTAIALNFAYHSGPKSASETWLAPIFLYNWQKEIVRLAIGAVFERVKNEYEVIGARWG